MPLYHKLGLSLKRHTQFIKPDGGFTTNNYLEPKDSMVMLYHTMFTDQHKK
jgi:hypothetical protein